MELKVKNGSWDIVLCDCPEYDFVILRPFETHFGSPAFAEHEFQQFVKEILEDPNSLVIGMGDMMDFALREGVGDVYQQKLSPQEQMEACVELLRPLAEAEKILALLGGNHERRVIRETGINPAYWVANALNVPYIDGEQGIIKIRVGKGPNLKPVAYIVHVAHGRTASRTAGGKYNRALEMFWVVPNADVYIMGHTHGIQTGKHERKIFDPYNNIIREEIYHVVLAGSFLRYADYAKAAIYPPLPVGSPKIMLNGRRKEIKVET